MILLSLLESASQTRTCDTQKHADVASDISVVDYDFEDLEPPILTVEEAVERSSFFEVPHLLYPKEVGNISEGMDEADDNAQWFIVQLNVRNSHMRWLHRVLVFRNIMCE
ncbi:aldehyde oxidase 2 [Euphorbia peplus]|nr:aldehyde oxidase 2 [Euphorbia peplus]